MLGRHRKFTIVLTVCSVWFGFLLEAWAQDTVRYAVGPAFSVSVDGDASSIDFDRDGQADVSFSGGLFLCTTDIPVSGCTTSYQGIPMGTNSLLCIGSQFVVLPAGALIGLEPVSNAAWKPYASATLATYYFSPKYGTSSWGGPLNAPQEGYIGVRFQTAAGQHYGWVRARMPLQGTNTFEFTPIILDWAYETRPDTAISAGARPVAAVASPQVVRPGMLRLNWQSEIGKVYQVQFKDRLGAPGWRNLDIVVIATATNTIVDIPMNGHVGFFQAVRTE